MRVFLSWSGERSRAVAAALHRWLPRVLQSSEPWMSSDDVRKGERWSVAIGDSLGSHDVGIICVTPENLTAPWLVFEAGALSRSLRSGKVIPLLLGIRADEVTGPLREFQAAVIDKEEIRRVLASLNEELKPELPVDVLDDVFGKFWPELDQELREIATRRISGDGTAVREVIRAFASRGMRAPALGDQAFFESGFESHLLYGALRDVMRSRLWICGRKNRKLFDKEHRDLLRDLHLRVAAGFDLRVLFLSPEAPADVLRAAHRDDDFEQQLRRCIEAARTSLLGAGLNPERHCRTYRVHRTVSFAVVDEALLYSPIALDETGRAKPLTKAPFGVISAGSPLGAEIVDSFDGLWNNSAPLGQVV